MKYELFAAKAEDKLKDFADNSFDSCVVDGPYGIHFMGKTWDKFGGPIGIDHQLTHKRGGSMHAGLYNQSNQSNQLFQAWTAELGREVYRVLKPGAYFLSFCSPRTYHRLVCGIEDAGFEIRDTIMWVFGSGFPKNHDVGKATNQPQYNGWGTALKPAYEPICVARKPFEGTVAENFLKYGTGGINIGECRIDLGGDYKSGANGRPSQTGLADGYDALKANLASDIGRWPANIIHDGTPEVMELFPDSKGQQGDVKGTEQSRTGKNAYSEYGRIATAKRNNIGSAARFYYVPKTSRADRNEGCDHLVNKPLNWSEGSANPGSFQSGGTDKSSPNNHPTVKPTELMQYLVRLVTPKGGRCLDYLCGSGSTLKACAIEGFDCVGIDQDAHNIEIARCRVQYILDHQDLFGVFQRP